MEQTAEQPTLGQRIKERRENTPDPDNKEIMLTQEKLGQLCGRDKRSVSRWECDEAKPSGNCIPKLSSTLGIPVDDFLK